VDRHVLVIDTTVCIRGNYDIGRSMATFPDYRPQHSDAIGHCVEVTGAIYAQMLAARNFCYAQSGARRAQD